MSEPIKPPLGPGFLPANPKPKPSMASRYGRRKRSQSVPKDKFVTGPMALLKRFDDGEKL